MIKYLVLIYVVWVAIGLLWFMHNLGNKTKKDTLLDWILISPLFPIFYLIGGIGYLIDKFQK